MQFKPDKLSPPERMGALLTRKQPDRVPFIPFIFGYCAKNVGYPVASIYEDAEKSFWAQLWSSMQYDYDGGPLYAYASYGGWEFGGDIKMPRSEWEQAPVVTRFPVETEEDAWNLKLPEVPGAGCLPIAFKVAKIQAEMGMPVTVPLTGPFTMAGNICEVDRLCRWMMKKPELAHHILGLCRQHSIDVIKFWVKQFPPESILAFSGEATTANQVISPKQFKEFAMPYLKDVHQEMMNHGIKHVLCHICGEQNANLEYWAQVPMGDPGVVSFGHEVDLETAARYFPNDIIAGNIEPSVIQNGTHEQVYELCRIAIEKGKKIKNGYVLMAGCEVPVMAPPFNIWTMRKAINDFGWYD